MDGKPTTAFDWRAEVHPSFGRFRRSLAVAGVYCGKRATFVGFLRKPALQ